MKAAAIVLAVALGAVSAAHAQLGGLGKIKSIGDKAVDAKNKIDELNISEEEERQLGAQVSLELRNRFGVVQDEKVTRYVTLVGATLAQASSRPKLDWKFIVLDTDGVNAYATPGGFVHVTRGLLGLMKTEAELAGVLGHELTHITAKHTVRAIQKSKSVALGADAAGGSGGLRSALIGRMAEAAYKTILEGDFNRDDERESDEVGARLANKVGYAPNGISEVLKKIQARNGSRQERNGMFASHPAVRDRIASNEKLIKTEKLGATATVEARYQQNIAFEAKPITEIAEEVGGAAGLAGSDKKKADDTKAEPAKAAEPPKKKGFGSALGAITGNKQQTSTQQASSAGARGGVPDRDAKGGPNKNPINVQVSAAEIEAFRKGIGA